MLFAYSAQKELMIELNSVCMQTVKPLLAVKHETITDFSSNKKVTYINIE